MLPRLLLFGLLNFVALAIGSYFTGPGVSSEWYQSLNQAPWTPPGWVFGAAWTTIMVCFTIYMALLWDKTEDKTTLATLYGIQLVLNIIWNPIFFKFQMVGFGLMTISALLFFVFLILGIYWSTQKLASLLLLPYAIWLVIATSLNMYVWVMN